MCAEGKAPSASMCCSTVLAVARGQGKSLKAEVRVFGKCFLIMRPPAVAARMLLGQLVTLLSGHLVKSMLALCSLMALHLEEL